MSDDDQPALLLRRIQLGVAMLTLSALLLENGLPDLPVLLIDVHRNRAGTWRVKFSYEFGEPLSMSTDQASTMASSLRTIGQVELADEISDAVKSAIRFDTM